MVCLPLRRGVFWTEEAVHPRSPLRGAKLINRDRRCVFVANNMAAAVVTATWLTEKGLPAQVMDQMTLGGLEGLTALAPGISARGVEVWVDNPDHIPDASKLLAEHAASIAQRETEAQLRAPVEVVCEECGKKNLFPANQIGTVQDCPHCGEYLDIEEPGSGLDKSGEFAGDEAPE